MSVVHPSVCSSINTFQTTSPLKPLSLFNSNSIWSLLRTGKQKIANMVVVRWPRWSPCPYILKTFKNLPLQDWGCLGAESWHRSSGKRGLPKLLKWWLHVDIWPFHGKVKFASLSICISPNICLGKMLRISKGLLLWIRWADVAQISWGASLGQRNERLLKWSWFVNQDGHHAHIW